MIPKAYSSSVTYVQAAVVSVIIVCATVLMGFGRISEATWIAITGPIAGYIFGVHGTITGANGVASRIEKAASDAREMRDAA